MAHKKKKLTMAEKKAFEKLEKTTKGIIRNISVAHKPGGFMFELLPKKKKKKGKK